jgi:hypothetical protein
MKTYLLVAIATLLLTASSLAQPSGAPPASMSRPQVDDEEFAVSYLTFLRHDWNTGQGVEWTASHYFTKHLAFSADGEALNSTYSQFREYGLRGGPTLALFRVSRLQPFVRALAGFSHFRADYTGATQPYVNGFSYELGSGCDVRITGPVAARVAAGFEHDPNVPGSTTRLLRLAVGLNYHFGGYRR